MFFIPENVYDVNEIKKYLGYTEGEREKSGARLTSSMMEMSKECDRIYNSKRDKFDYLDLRGTGIFSIPEMRSIATLRFFNYLNNSGLSATEVAEETGYDKTSCAKMHSTIKKLPEDILHGERPHVPDTIKPLSIPTIVLPAVAKYVGHTNANELMFGKRGKILLPGIYSAAALGLGFLTGTEKEIIENHARSLWNIEKNKYREALSLTENNTVSTRCDLSPYGQIRSISEILKERFGEISEDAQDIYSAKGCLYSGAAFPHKLFVVLRGVISGKTPGLEKEAWGGRYQYEPGIKWLMMFAIFTAIDPALREKNLDFFIANDYVGIAGGASEKGPNTSVTPIFAVRNGVEIEITEPQSLRILSFLAALPKEVKPEIFSKIFAGIARSKQEQLGTLFAETMHKPYLI